MEEQGEEGHMTGAEEAGRRARQKRADHSAECLVRARSQSVMCPATGRSVNGSDLLPASEGCIYASVTGGFSGENNRLAVKEGEEQLSIICGIFPYQSPQMINRCNKSQ